MFRPALFALSLLTAFAAPAAAEFSAQQTVERVVVTTNADGERMRTFVPAELVSPGDELKYSLVYANETAEAAEQVVLTMPVPKEVAYVEYSATEGPVEVLYSADGGESFATRADLRIADNGEMRRALPEEITHLRWTFVEPIAPGESGSIGYRGVLR